MAKRLTTEEFIERALFIHGDKYDYSNVNYYSSNKLIEIICSIHGKFIQIPESHLSGSGCKPCGIDRQTLKISKKISDFYTCSTCLLLQPKENFHKKKNKHGVRSICKTCRVIERSQTYIKNKDKELECGRNYKLNFPEKRKETAHKSAAKNFAEFRLFINNIKNVPCYDCKVNFYPCAMDFDHCDPSTKSFNISEAQSINEKIILEEIKKCNIVCANCHRIREHNRRYKKLSSLNKIIYPYKSINCYDCKVQYPPYAMDFDHRDPSSKLFNISKPPYINMQLIMDEIAKCDVVCANCHRIRTFVKE